MTPFQDNLIPTIRHFDVIRARLFDETKNRLSEKYLDYFV